MAYKDQNLLCFNFMVEVMQSYITHMFWCKYHTSWQIVVVSHFIQNDGGRETMNFVKEFVRQPGGWQGIG